MSGNSFSSGFFGTFGVIIALFVIFVLFPLLLVAGCFIVGAGTAAGVASQVDTSVSSQPAASSAHRNRGLAPPKPPSFEPRWVMVGSWNGASYRQNGQFASAPFKLLTGEVKLARTSALGGGHSYSLQLHNLDLGRSFGLQAAFPDKPFGDRKLPPGNYRIILSSNPGNWVCKLLEKREYDLPGQANLPFVTLNDVGSGGIPSAGLAGGPTLEPPNAPAGPDPKTFVEQFNGQVERMRDLSIEFAKIRGPDHPETKELEDRLFALEEVVGWLSGATPEQISAFAKALTTAKTGGTLTPDEARLLYTLRCFVGDPSVEASIARADPMLKKLMVAIAEKAAVAESPEEPEELPDDVREWSKDGESMGELRFVDLISSVVYLEDINGYEVKVRLGELSDDDRDWIKKWKRGDRPIDNACPRCKGRGLIKCLNRQCKGGVIKGKDTVTSYGPLGNASGVVDTTVGSCRTCKGTGAVICPMCGGKGEKATP
jgi:hypothetical protein